MPFSPEEKAVLISANEDYLTLADAVLEMIPFSSSDRTQEVAAHTIRDLIERDYIYVTEMQETAKERREVRRLDKEVSLAILEEPANWSHFNLQGASYYALSPTDRGRQAFRQLIGASD
jgi:hypothetical protein